MKVVTPNSNHGTGRSYPPPPISLLETSTKEPRKLDKSKFAKVSLFSNPGNPDSEEKLTVEFPCFESGTPKELLDWFENPDRVLKGQRITGGPARHAAARMFLRDEGLRAFNAAATEHGAETLVNFKLVSDDLKKHFFPLKSLVKQKRYMRRFIRKPRDLSCKEYQACLQTLNGYLVHFPGANTDSKLDDFELMDILEFGIPTAWNREMVRMDFDPSEKGLPAFMDLLERLEVIDTIHDPSGPKRPKPDRKNGDASTTDDRKMPAPKGKRKNKHCKIHKNNSHDTSECRGLDKFIRDNQKPEAANTPPWKRSKYEGNNHGKTKYSNNYNSKQELNEIASAVQKVLAKKSGKNKRKHGAASLPVKIDSSDSDSDSDAKEERFEFDFSSLDLTNE
jgi:hypothetical protein